jgi:hypothetical protein
MTDLLELPSLYVEGEYDVHTLIHLVGKHGISLDKELGPVIIRNAKNDRGVLASMRTAARASTFRPVGFVIDADIPIAQRWQSVCDHLKDLGLVLPNVAPNSGFVGDSTETKSRIGVWIMPDNRTDKGQLEDFVRTLIPAGDALDNLSTSSTGEAVKLGARFSEKDRQKAELHCWLAWQKDPGLSFGTAIKTRLFRHDSDTAKLFFAWFKRLYGMT